MDQQQKWKIILGAFYLITAIVLVLVAYYFYIKKFKRAKLKSMSGVSLITSRENVFSKKTKFLIVSPSVVQVKVDLLNENEGFVKTLIDAEIADEELPFDFDPADYDSGKYYLSLTSDNAKILRSITIAEKV